MLENEISISDFEVMELKEGDIVLVRPKQPISQNRLMRIANSLKLAGEKAGVKVLFLPNYDLSILRTEVDLE